jgi:hypothetical protein
MNPGAQGRTSANILGVGPPQSPARGTWPKGDRQSGECEMFHCSFPPSGSKAFTRSPIAKHIAARSEAES